MPGCAVCAAVAAARCYQNLSDYALSTAQSWHQLWDRLPDLPFTGAQDSQGRPGLRYQDREHYLWVTAAARAASRGEPFDPPHVPVPPPPERLERQPQGQRYFAHFRKPAAGHLRIAAVDPDAPPVAGYEVPMELELGNPAASGRPAGPRTAAGERPLIDL